MTVIKLTQWMCTKCNHISSREFKKCPVCNDGQTYQYPTGIVVQKVA